MVERTSAQDRQKIAIKTIGSPALLTAGQGFDLLLQEHNFVAKCIAQVLDNGNGSCYPRALLTEDCQYQIILTNTDILI